MTANTHADAVVLEKMKLLPLAAREALRTRFARCLVDHEYSEQVRLARTPVVPRDRHLRQAQDLIAAIDALT